MKNFSESVVEEAAIGWLDAGGPGMTVLSGDCVEVMAGMEPESVDAIVTDPPYGLEFMGKEWDRLDTPGGSNWSAKWTEKPDWRGNTRRRPGRLYNSTSHETCQLCRKQKHQHDANKCPEPVFVREWHQPRQLRAQQQWHQQWAAAALRVAKPGAYLLAFGGTRTSHRLACAIEDAGWIIRDTLVWAYAQGFPKSRANLKPAWEPIVMARKPGPLRELVIDECRIGTEPMGGYDVKPGGMTSAARQRESGYRPKWQREDQPFRAKEAAGRWPANVILTDPIFDGGWEGVVGGGTQTSGTRRGTHNGSASWSGEYGPVDKPIDGSTGGYSRMFLIPKAPPSERRIDGERSPHPTQKPEALIRHLVKLVNVGDGVILDPFLGSGTLGVVCDGLGIKWIGIEREPEYAAWAERRVAAAKPEWERTA